MSNIFERRFKHIVFLTGAGISVASGLRPYRGPGGLWEEGDTARMSSARVFDDDPEGAWRFWSRANEMVAAALPNAAHKSLVELESKLTSDQQMTIITQNIDGLHQRAGSKNVIELHGTLSQLRCSSCEAPGDYSQVRLPELPRCTKCSGVLRPCVVLFDEMLPVEAEWHTKRVLRECDLFVAVGTSGTVSPASRFVDSAKYVGAKTVLINLEPMNPPNRSFDIELNGKAEELLPKLVAQL